MRLTRMTTRRLMIAVAAVAVLLHMGITAIHVESRPEYRWVAHIWECKNQVSIGPQRVAFTECRAPFWPKYWRRLLGRPWPGTFQCECHAEEKWIGDGLGDELRPYRCVRSVALSQEEVIGLESSLRSLKVIGLARSRR